MSTIATKVSPVERKVVTFYKADGIEIPYEKLDREVIPLGATQIEITLANVPLESLRLDPTNPRIRYRLQARGMFPKPTEDDLTELLWEDNDVKQLKRSIQANGGLIEAIIVQADGSVVEGNCRTVSYRKLNFEAQEADSADTQWSKVRARILPKGISREQLDILLGELHISGKNEWQPFEQAAHLYRMSQKGFSETVLAEMFRQSKTSISHKIRAYRLMMEKYLPTFSDPKNLSNWSYFEEFYKVCKPKAGDPDGIALEDKFVGWMGNGKFSKGAEVRQLPKILTDTEARKELEQTGFQQAWDIVKAKTPELDSALFRSVVKATEELRKAPMDEIHDVQTGNKSKLKKLQELQKAVEDFLKQAGTSR